ncbi:hypothetical protein [Brevibacterium oceani]|uniref:hypothetical protein n=1 Tax=Brevibacterium oceani TaxID=358099 RepID=UPI0015E65304|nr:hypothetical protein [Brevibacterium oceani]
MTLKTRIATILREWAHRLDQQPYVVAANEHGWTIKTKEGLPIAKISTGRSV